MFKEKTFQNCAKEVCFIDIKAICQLTLMLTMFNFFVLFFYFLTYT